VAKGKVLEVAERKVWERAGECEAHGLWILRRSPPFSGQDFQDFRIMQDCRLACGCLRLL